MSGRIVYAHIANQASGAGGAVGLINVLASSTSPIRLLGFEITSAAIAAALVTLTLGRVSTAGSGGTGITEALSDERSTGLLSAAVKNATTAGTAVAAGLIMGWQWEQLGPLGHVWTPEMAPVAKVSNGFELNLVTAVAVTYSGWVCWEELGA